jgi:hypothetical protein
MLYPPDKIKGNHPLPMQGPPSCRERKLFPSRRTESPGETVDFPDTCKCRARKKGKNIRRRRSRMTGNGGVSLDSASVFKRLQS